MDDPHGILLSRLMTQVNVNVNVIKNSFSRFWPAPFCTTTFEFLHHELLAQPFSFKDSTGSANQASVSISTFRHLPAFRLLLLLRPAFKLFDSYTTAGLLKLRSVSSYSN